MLRSSSLAMLNSGMIKNKSKGADRAKPGYDDVVKTRARILSGISPAQMTVKNLTSFLALFGMQRKEAVERAAKYFLFAVPCSSHTRTTNQSLQLDDDENQEDGAWLQEKLPFEVFYRLMRALQGPKRSAKSGDFSSEIGKSYLASELLSRLLFCALVGHEGVHHSSGAAARFHDDASAQPVSVANLAHSLRLLLSHELLQSESSLEAQVQALAEPDPQLRIALRWLCFPPHKDHSRKGQAVTGFMFCRLVLRDCDSTEQCIWPVRRTCFQPAQRLGTDRCETGH